ncbi:MAG: type II secretion system F family protein [Clostridiales bacterium]|nr:type II secretion system F family protein [Clostridiales bacterium]
MRIYVALASVGIAVLYFRQFVLIMGAAAVVYMLVLPIVGLREESRARRKLRKDALLWLEELTIALKAGKSLTTATRDLAMEMDEGEGGAWRHCLGLIHLHYPIELVYRALADRIGLPEWRSLSALVGSAMDTGANLPRVFIRSAEGLREQLESVEALESALASRRMEGCLLAASPAVYTAFLRFAAPDYMAPLYVGSGWVAALVVFALQLSGSALFFRMLIREESTGADRGLASFQEEMAMHIQAGLSLPEAWQRAVGSGMTEGRTMGAEERNTKGAGAKETGAHGTDAEMWERLGYVSRQLAMGVPFARAVSMLTGRNGGTSELRRMAEMLEQNYQLGGNALATLLQTEAREARQRRLMNRRAKDAKRETVLLFPMLLLLLSALILTAAPALLSV